MRERLKRCRRPRRRRSGSAFRQAVDELIEDRRVERPLELEPGVGTLYPGDLGPQRFEGRQSDNYPLAGIDHFNELDPAAVGRYVPRRELEAEAAELFHADFMFNGTPAAPAAATLGRRRLLSRDDCIGAHPRDRRWERGRRRAGIRAQCHALHAIFEDWALQTHWSTARLMPISFAPFPSSRTSRRVPRSDTTTK
jgi:hypothetical protein